MGERITIFDTTLRDGGQTQGVDFGAPDKAAIARELERPAGPARIPPTTRSSPARPNWCGRGWWPSV
jgi:hypothetical protein